MDSLESTLFGILFGDYDSAEKVGNDTVDNYTIDTCDTVDQGFETAIWYKGNDMVIVQRYPDAASAAIGHKKWVNICKEEHPRLVFSVQTDEVEQLF